MNPLTALNLVFDTGFQWGLLIGAVALGMRWVTGPHGDWTPWVTGAALAAMWADGNLEASLTASVLTAAILAAATARFRFGPSASTVVATITLLVLARPDVEIWIAAFVAGAGILALPAFLRPRLRPTLQALAFTLTTGGIWATTPDTELSKVVLAVAAVALVSAFVQKGAYQSSPAGAAALVVLVNGVILLEGVGREGALVGAAGSWGWLALGTLLYWTIRPFPHRSETQLLTVHVALVLLWSRGVGLLTNPLAALALGIPITVVIAGGLALLPPRTPEKPEYDDPIRLEG